LAIGLDDAWLATGSDGAAGSSGGMLFRSTGEPNRIVATSPCPVILASRKGNAPVIEPS
jgi:hypothetical protein